MHQILYVDDDDVNLQIFLTAFGEYYSIRTASSSKEALAFLEKEPVDIVITDQRMSEMSGIVFLEQVIARYPDVVRIVITAFKEVEEVMYALNCCGVYRYFTKPWTFEEVKHTLDKALEMICTKKKRENLLQTLQKDKADLQKKVEDCTTQFQRTKEIAERATKVKDTFLSQVSHEIRTPLNAIIGTANLLKNTPLTSEQEESIEILNLSSRQLLALINDILDISKIRSGSVSVKNISFSPKPLFEKLVNAFETAYKTKGVLLNVHYEPPIPETLIGDAVRLGQVVNKLLSNALKFSKKGDTVQVKVASPEQNEKAAILSVEIQDTGIGIAADKLQYIFEDFTQVNNQHNREFGGTGLGLAICKQVVEMMGGSISAESQEELGSVFRFSIPFQKAPSNKKQTKAKPKSLAETKGRLQGVHILVAEDNLLNQKVLLKFLKLWEASEKMVENGIEAVAEVQRNHYGLILMDLQMPLKDGYEAAEEIRQLQEKQLREIPIIALTASSLAADQEKAKQVNINFFVEKPFDPIDLLMKIEYCLQR